MHQSDSLFFFSLKKNSFGKTMPRYKKAGASPREAKFRSPNVVVRSSRRATLAGPAQLLGKQSVSPVVMLEGNVMGKIKKALSNAGKSQFKSPDKPAAKKTVSKRSPKTVKASTKPKKDVPILSPRRSQHAARAKSSSKPSSPKRQKSPSPKKKPVSPKKKLVSPKNKSETPKRKSVSPKAKLETPSHLYSLRSAGAISPKPVHEDKTETQSARKTVSASRKRGRSASPASKKKTKVIALAGKRKRSPVARTPEKENAPKPAGKRKRTAVSGDESEEKLSPPQKKKLLKSESQSALKKSSKKVSDTSLTEVKSKTVAASSVSAVKKTSKKVADTSFTEVKSKMVAANSLKPGITEISASQQNSTPLKPKLAENSVSMNWNMSSVKKRLLDSITPYRMKAGRETPVSADTRQKKSALFSGKKTDSPEKRTTRRQSVRFLLNGKADTVKELKQRSSRKRFCYRMCQYVLLFGLPAAVTVGSILVYNGLI